MPPSSLPDFAPPFQSPLPTLTTTASFEFDFAWPFQSLRHHLRPPLPVTSPSLIFTRHSASNQPQICWLLHLPVIPSVIKELNATNCSESSIHETTLMEQVMARTHEWLTVATLITDALHTMHDGRFLHLPIVDKCYGSVPWMSKSRCTKFWCSTYHAWWKIKMGFLWRLSM